MDKRICHFNIVLKIKAKLSMQGVQEIMFVCDKSFNSIFEYKSDKEPFPKINIFSGTHGIYLQLVSNCYIISNMFVLMTFFLR